MDRSHPYEIARSIGQPPSQAGCVLLFSGGRDSTCAALRLLTKGRHPILLTVVDSTAQTDDRTRQRVNEMRSISQDCIYWLSARVPELYRDVLSLELSTAPSCLPCLFVRLSVGILLAKQHGVDAIAAGFTSYQSTWVEQTPTAITEVTRFVKQYGLALELPVRDLASQQEASRILQQHSLTPTPLEPTCHCAAEGTRKNPAPADVRRDVSHLVEPCDAFISHHLKSGKLS